MEMMVDPGAIIPVVGQQMKRTGWRLGVGNLVGLLIGLRWTSIPPQRAYKPLHRETVTSSTLLTVHPGLM